MIVARSPFRISFAGGGTDLPAFYEKYGPGVVVSTSINRHMYVTVNQKFDGKVSVRYRIHENADTVRELKHPLIREILKFYGVIHGIEIVIISEVPAKGSGLGASSALAVALCAAMDRFTGVHASNTYLYRKSLAETASNIEIKKVGSPIGKQDHYASAIGGLNRIKFMQDGTVEGESFEDSDFISEIEGQSMLFYLDMEHAYHEGGGHFIQKVLKDQIEEMEQNKNTHTLQRDNAFRLWENMTYAVPERFMDHINENWRLKRSLHDDITNPEIDAIIQRAYKSGATAAKVCGAGGGGFLYLLVPKVMQDDVRRELSELNELKFGFDKKGVEVIFDSAEEHVEARA
jgi:D-glycero-alpha-D-manno-heptose-7-phosphate kinase